LNFLLPADYKVKQSILNQGSWQEKYVLSVSQSLAFVRWLSRFVGLIFTEQAL
jgi:hypothetical protein